jgi:hypothetical protein
MKIPDRSVAPVNLGEAALNYAAKGLPVFPCNPATKRPFTAHGFESASNDAETVRAWWARHPDAMIGIPTGAASKTWVLDVDDPALFEAACFELPPTRRCETGKGYHLYFKHDPGVRNSQVLVKDGKRRWPFAELPGVEVRGEGGYVIAPPSLHPTGRRYAWTADLPIADAPESLLRIVRKQGRSANVGPTSDIQADTSWGLAALDGECANIASAGNGEQEGTLNGAALKIGAICAGGGLSLATARLRLIQAGLGMASHNPRDPWTPQAIVAKIERGLKDGAANPRTPAERMRFCPQGEGAARHARGEHSDPEPDFDPETGEVRNNLPEPVDLWAHYSAPQLPSGLLPDVIERFARKHGEVMGADPAGLAMAALTVCATAITDDITLQVKKNDPTWKESPRLWVALVGPPSRKKSPIFKAAMRPLRRLDSNLMSDYLAKLRDYEALPNDQRKAAPKPKQKRLLISDATVEAAQEVMKDSPDGILSEQDELSGWFGAMDKFASGKGSQADRAFYLKSYNGGTYNLNRITRGAMQIPNLSINLLGGIQPEPLRKIANDTVDDGLIQRLLPVILRPASVGRDVPADGVIAEYERLIESLVLMRPPLRGGIATDDHSRSTPIRFDDRTRAIRERLEVEHLALVEALETVSPKLAAHYGKFDGLFARLCLLWHCIENAAAIHPPAEIAASTAERVAKFMATFIRPSAVAFYAGMLGLSAGHEELIALAAWIVAKGLDEVGARDAQRSTQSLRHLAADEVRMLCEKLESFGWLERGEPAPKSNTPRWIVNPRVHDLFGDRAAAEQARREAAREALRDALQV